MFDRLYMGVLDMSKTAAMVIAVVLLVRLLLKKAPKAFSYALWAVVLFRLLCPISFETPVSIVPQLPDTSTGYNLADESIDLAGAGMAAYQAVGDLLNGGLGVQHIPTTEVTEDGMTRYVMADWWSVWILFGKYVWAAGMAVMLLYSAFSYRRIKKQIEIAVPIRDNIWIADDIKSPFVIGFVRPRIYLPGNLGEKEQEYIILHEQHHIRRFDHIFKALAFLALTIHWFNPLVWLAFGLACKDMEMSCDEAVIRKLGGEVRADYSASLLTLATGRRIIAGTPLAFGEGDTKGRIRNLAKWKMPAVWVIVIAAVLCVVLAVTLLTDRTMPNESDNGITCYLGTVQDITGESVTLLCDYGEERQFALADGCILPVTSIMGEHVAVYTTTQYSTALPIVTRIEFEEWELQSSLEEAIMSAILAHHSGKYYPAECQTAHFEKLAEVTKDDQIICYGIVLYQEYNLTDGVLEGAAGALIPTVLTFHASQSDGLYLTEYWEPRDGAYYAEDIKAKFLGQPWPDTTKYLAEQEVGCYLQAASYYDVGTDTIVHSILTDMESHNRWADGFSDLMISCEHDRKMLSAIGTDTVRYCFERFQEGGHDDLYGQIMAYVCSEILEARGVKPIKDWSFQQSGQDWFDAFTNQYPQWQELIPSDTQNQVNLNKTFIPGGLQLRWGSGIMSLIRRKK